MNEVSERKVPLGMFLGIAVLSASLLAFQVLLTRVCALRLAFHFGFLIISNSLLGIGASGSFLTLFEGRWRKKPVTWIWAFTVLYVISLLATWEFARSWAIPEQLKFAELKFDEFLQFAIFNLGLAVPFFFGGGAVGLNPVGLQPPSERRLRPVTWSARRSDASCVRSCCGRSAPAARCAPLRSSV